MCESKHCGPWNAKNFPAMMALERGPDLLATVKEFILFAIIGKP